MQGFLNMQRCIGLLAELTYTFKDHIWRYPVDLGNKKCSFKRWELSGKRCIHAVYFMTYLGGELGKVDQYVSEYFHVAKFKEAYADNVPALFGEE